MKIYRYGKDQESQPCIELDDGTRKTELEIVMALIKTLVQKGTFTVAELKANLQG